MFHQHNNYTFYHQSLELKGLVIVSKAYTMKLASSMIYQDELGYMEEVSNEFSSFVGILMMWSLLPTYIVLEHHLIAPCYLTVPI